MSRNEYIKYTEAYLNQIQTENTQLNIEVVEYVPGQTSPQVIDKFMDYLLRRIKILNPNDPPPSVELLKENVLEQHPHRVNIRLIGYCPALDKVVGSGQVSFETEESPSYQYNKHTCYGGVGVEETYRNHGVGRQLMFAVVERVAGLGRDILQVDSEEASGQEYMKNLGIGQVAMESAENRLYFENVDWDKMHMWDKEGRERSPNTKLVSFLDVPEDLIEQFTAFHTRAMNTIPKEAVEWEGVVTPESRRIEEKRYKDKGSIWRSLITVEEDGAISGLTEMIHNPKEPHVAYQELTAVLPEYRGRGLGKWLKASMLLYMHQTYPGIEYVVTGNADVNAPMLAINEKMGFRRYRGNVSFKFKVKELLEKFAITQYQSSV